MVTKSKAHLFFLLCRWALKTESKMKAPLHPSPSSTVSSFPSAMLPQMTRKKDSQASLQKQISEPALGNKTKPLLDLFSLVDLFDKDPFRTSFLEFQKPFSSAKVSLRSPRRIEERPGMWSLRQCFLASQLCLSIYLLTLRSHRLRIKVWRVLNPIK